MVNCITKKKIYNNTIQKGGRKSERKIVLLATSEVKTRRELDVSRYEGFPLKRRVFFIDIKNDISDIEYKL